MHQTKTLIVGGAVRRQVKIGPDSDSNYPYKSRATAGEIDKWIVLSVHWDNDTSPAGNNSNVYCNGKKLASFQSAKLGSIVRQTIIGDNTGAGYSPPNGYIGNFIMYKSVENAYLTSS